MGRPSASVRKPYDADSLLDVAVRVFSARGYDASTMDHVARAAGITKASLYYHVAGKEELLDRALRRALDALFGVLDEPQATEGRGIERMRHVLRRTVDIILGQLPEVTLLIRVRGNTETERRALERRREFDRRMADLLHLAIREGDLRADLDGALTTRLVFGMLNSVTEWYRPGGRLGAAELATAAEALVFAGVRPRAD